MHKYREGKVKRTPTRGVKQFLKPDAYKQSEPVLQIPWMAVQIPKLMQRNLEALNVYQMPRHLVGG